MSNTAILAIDFQNDFCLPGAPLCVAGAIDDVRRAAALVTHLSKSVKTIIATLDSHQTLHIGNLTFWRDRKGNMPAPFTQITVEDVESRAWAPFHPGLYSVALAYVRALRTNGRYTLTAWPVHCRIGSHGAALVREFDQALYDWEVRGNRVTYVAKGSNMLTEHFSGIQADVQYADDPSTKPNTMLLDMLSKPVDEGGPTDILVMGEASSHCVANTLDDIIRLFGAENAQRLVLITDCMSPVLAPGIEHLAPEFFARAKAAGVRTALSADF